MIYLHVMVKLTRLCKTEDSSDITCTIDSTLVSSLAFLADGSLMTNSSRNNKHRITIWVTKHGRIKEVESPLTIEHDEGIVITAVIAYGDGGYLISGDEHGKLIYWKDIKNFFNPEG